MAFDILGGVDWMQQQAEKGRASFADKLMGQAYMAPPEQRQSALQQLAGRGFGREAMATGAVLEQQDGVKQKRQAELLAQGAEWMSAMTAEQRAQAWPVWRQRAASVDPELAGMLPEQYDDAQIAPFIQQIAGRDGIDPKVLSPGAAMVGPDGRVIYRNPAVAGYSVQEYTKPDGSVGYLQIATKGEDPGIAHGVNPAGSVSVGQPQPASGNYADVQGTLDAIGRKYGFATTSTVRSPQENVAANGVPNSQHLAANGGTARDFSIKGKSPQEIQAMVSELQSAGFEVIASDHGTGPHIHAELPPGALAGAGGGMVPTSNAGGGMPSGAPVASPAPAGGGFGGTYTDQANAAAQKAEFEARARRTAESQVDLQYAPAKAAAEAVAAAAKATAEAGVERQSTARTKAPQLLNVERGLTRIETAMQALEKGLVTDSGPLDQWALKFTEGGQELENAVGAIQNDMLALTRVPGVGSQSDLEQRIALLKYPKLGNHPEVNRNNVKQLRAFLKDLQDSINGAQQSAPAAGNTDDDALIGKYL